MKKIKTILLIICIPQFACSTNKEDRETTRPGINNPLTPAHILSGYTMVWNDEFDGTSVNTSKWNYRGEGTVRNYATVSRQTISLNGNGQVSIKVNKNTDGKYYVGQLGTQGIFETTYGYFECRALMNKGFGPHVAFWLQSPDLGKTGDPVVDGTEIDIFEYHRKTPGNVHHNLHWDGYGVNHKHIGTQIPYAAADTGYHTFGLEWTEKEYIFYVDGKETWRTQTAVSKRREYLILSTELTGWGGDPATGTFPDEILFDYVRVYKSKQ